MLKNLLKSLNELFSQQHHQSSVKLHLGKGYAEPVIDKDLKYLHPPSLRA
jgi:hypothetical protein